MKKLPLVVLLTSIVSVANAGMIDNFTLPNTYSGISDLGGNNTPTAIPVQNTGFSDWTRSGSLLATGRGSQSIQELTTGTMELPKSYLQLSESANSRGTRVLEWDSTTGTVVDVAKDVLEIDFKNVDQSFDLALDLNGSGTIEHFAINAGDTNFVVKLSDWLTIGDPLNNVWSQITSVNSGVDLQITSVSTHVPEPDVMLLLFAAGLLGFGYSLKKKSIN